MMAFITEEPKRQIVTHFYYSTEGLEKTNNSEKGVTLELLLVLLLFLHFYNSYSCMPCYLHCNKYHFYWYWYLYWNFFFLFSKWQWLQPHHSILCSPSRLQSRPLPLFNKICHYWDSSLKNRNFLFIVLQMTYKSICQQKRRYSNIAQLSTRRKRLDSTS